MDTTQALSAKAAAFGGAVAGFIARMTAAPFDVVKIRLQLNQRAASPTLLNAMSSIYKEEGLKTFFRGNVPAIMLWVGYGSFQFAAVNYLKQALGSASRGTWLSETNFLNTQDVVSFGAGGMAAFTATILTHPFDVLRTRFAGQGIPKVYNSIWAMAYGSGVKGLYSGLVPSLVNVAPAMGISFSAYNFISRNVSTTSPGVNESIRSAIAGGGAGLMTKLVLYPLDISKKRLQMQGIVRDTSRYGTSMHYEGMIDCLRKIVKHEGFTTGLYKGFLPTTYKAVVSTSCTFVAYEYFSKFWADEMER
jgi:solute carrier family 25 (mitochondrial thiamine pyrophosphate transporter), member 19